VVANNEPASIRDSVALIRLLGARKDGACIHVLANMVSGAREGERVFQWILESLGDTRSAILSYAGFVPSDDLLRKAVVSRNTVVSAAAFTRLCRQVHRWPRSRHAHGHIEFFVERLLQHETSRWRYCHER
jgi:flagellar biosynthesis protein FlhG